jgi:1-acyl-sn-glycerol-3-phosphate acyltransferase
MEAQLAAVARAGRRSSAALVSALASLGRARMWPAPTIATRAAQLAVGMREQCTVHDLDIEVTGRLPEGPAVVVANHLSYLDCLVLCAQAPFVPIAKGEVAGWPLIGPAASALGVLFVDRSNPLSGARALRGALRALRAGVSVLNFPEGTTTDGSCLLPFKRGIFGVALLAKVPVVPIALAFESPDLCWTGGDTFVPHYLRTAARSSTVVRLAIGQPIKPRRHDSADELAAFTHDQMSAMLDGRALPRRHEPAERLRVPAPRPDAVLPLAGRRRRQA